MNTAEAYEKVTARMIAQLEAGTAPWQKPWQGGDAKLGGLPISAHGHKYRGINLLILMSAGYASPVWLTYNQAKKLGGNVKRGEKGTAVLLWKKGRTYTEKSAGGDETERRGFYATTFTVFNAEQCEGLPETIAPAVEAVPASELVAGYLADGGPKLTHGGNRAFYSPMGDFVGMPKPVDFKSFDHYLSTLFHELVHSTGHSSRLARLENGPFGSHAYSKEELVAELGAAFLCARAGSSPFAKRRTCSPATRNGGCASPRKACWPPTPSSRGRPDVRPDSLSAGRVRPPRIRRGGPSGSARSLRRSQLSRARRLTQADPPGARAGSVRAAVNPQGRSLEIDRPLRFSLCVSLPLLAVSYL